MLAFMKSRCHFSLFSSLVCFRKTIFEKRTRAKAKTGRINNTEYSWSYSYHIQCIHTCMSIEHNWRFWYWENVCNVTLFISLWHNSTTTTTSSRSNNNSNKLLQALYKVFIPLCITIVRYIYTIYSYIWVCKW